MLKGSNKISLDNRSLTVNIDKNDQRDADLSSRITVKSPIVEVSEPVTVERVVEKSQNFGNVLNQGAFTTTNEQSLPKKEVVKETFEASKFVSRVKVGLGVPKVNQPSGEK